MRHPRFSELRTRLPAGIGFLFGILALLQVDLLFTTGIAIKNETTAEREHIADTLILTQSGRKVSSTSEVPPPSPDQVVAQVSKDESLKLRRDFQKKLLAEIRDLKDRQKQELKDANQDRKNRKKEFDEREKQARRKFFEENIHGPERRAYMHDLIERRKIFYQALKDEEKKQKSDQNAAREGLEGSQRRRRQEFDAALSRNLRPPESVWAP